MAYLFLCSLCNFSVTHTWSKLQERFCTTRLSAVLIPGVLFVRYIFFFSWAVFSHSIAWKSFFLPSKKGEILKKVNNWKRPWKTALSDSFPTIWFSFQIACDTKRKFDLASRVTVLQIFPRKYWSVFITLARIYLFHTSCTSGLFKLFPNNQTDDNTGLARTAVPCGQFKLV